MISDIAFFSECGVRPVNQDAIYVSAKEERGIFVVADGMGGHSDGAAASSAIVNGIRNWWSSNEFDTASMDIDAVFHQCNCLLNNINAEIFYYFNSRGQFGGSTIVVLILWDGRYTILSAGDSRIYRAREKELEQLTVDDVWENLPEVKFEMSRESMECDSRFGKLTEAMGSDEQIRISRYSGMLTGRETFLLCSDGVYKFCTKEDLQKIMCHGSFLNSADKMKEKIRKCALKRGVDDNYSAIICCTKTDRDL